MYSDFELNDTSQRMPIFSFLFNLTQNSPMSVGVSANNKKKNINKFNLSMEKP